MSRAWQEAPEERPGEARPGALLTAAAAVPLGLAVLLAAAMLPAGARLAVGVAVVVLGLRVRAEATTVLGVRTGPATVRAIGTAAVVLGAVLAAGGLTVVAVDVVGGTSVADEVGEGGTLGAGSALLVSALVAVAGGVLVAFGSGVRPPAATGDRDVDPARPTDAGDRALGALVAGVGGALALRALTALDALDLGAGTAAVVLLAAAALTAGEGLRRAAGDVAGRGLLVAAGVLLACAVGDVTQLLTGVVGAAGGPSVGALESSAGRGAQHAVATGLAVVLLVAAIRRRDAVLGVLPLGVVLLTSPIEGTGEKIGTLLVPVLAVALLGAAVGGAGPLARRFAPETLRAALGAAALVLVSAAGLALSGTRGSDDDVLAVGLLFGAVGIVVLAGVVALARETAGRAGVALGVAALVALVLVSPFVAVQEAGTSGSAGSIPFSVVVWLAGLGATAAVVQRRREPLVLAAAAVVLATTTARLAIVVAVRHGLQPGDLDVVLGAQLAPAAVVLLAAALVALLGPARVVRRAQAAGSGAAYAAAVSAVGAAQLLQQFGLAPLVDGRASPGSVLDGGALVVAVLLLLLLAAGGALLGASTARRPSRVVALGVLGIALGAAVLAAGVGLAADEPGSGGDGAVRGTVGPSAGDLALGLRTVSSASRAVGPGWPILFGVLGAVLLAAAWWLESRRPVPADAPLA